MKYTIRLFAAARELAGKDTATVEADLPLTVAELRRILSTNYPALAPLLPHVRFAVNNAYATDQTNLQPQDEIACIPPVSGG